MKNEEWVILPDWHFIGSG